MSSRPSAPVSLRAAGKADIPCIENMMQFYVYDFSEWYPIALAESGLFSLRNKDAYWARATVRPFLIMVGDELAGFAVVDSEVVHEASEFNLGYFFVARRYRGSGVGRRAAELLCRGFGGAWEVYHLAQNKAAGAFWLKAISALDGKDSKGFEHSEAEIDGDATRLFRFAMVQASNAAFNGGSGETGQRTA